MLCRKDPTQGVFGPLSRAYFDLAETFSVELSVLSGSPALELVNEAEIRRPDAIVIGVKTGAGEARLGRTAWGVLQRSRLPVLLLPPPDDTTEPQEDGSPLQASQIVHPTDFSPMAHRSMRFARDLAAGAELPISLVHVLEHAPTQENEARAEDAARERLASMARGLEAEGLKAVDFHVARGIVWKSILQIAEAVPGSLIVMGSRGRRFISNLILGSQSRDVVRHARNPLFLIPPAWRAPSRGAEPAEGDRLWAE